MVKIFFETGSGEVVELEKNNFEVEESIWSVVGNYLRDFDDLKGFSVPRCTFKGKGISPHTVLTPQHDEIFAKLRTYEIRLDYKFEKTGLGWVGTVKCQETGNILKVLKRKLKENKHPEIFKVKYVQQTLPNGFVERIHGTIYAGSTYVVRLTQTNMPHRVSEAIEAGLHQISDRLDARPSAFVEILTERMDDNTLSRVETVKSRVSQLLSPKDTPEYTKLNVDYNDLSKKLASAQEDFEKETNRLKEVIRQCQAECREKDEITVKLRDELNNSRTECSENLQMVQGYKKRIGEEIEKNVKSENQIEALKKELAAKEEALKKHEELGREIYQKACVCEKEDATENQDEERHKEEDSVQNVEEQASEEVNDENTAKEDFEVVELTSC